MNRPSEARAFPSPHGEAETVRCRVTLQAHCTRCGHFEVDSDVVYNREQLLGLVLGKFSCLACDGPLSPVFTVLDLAGR